MNLPKTVGLLDGARGDVFPVYAAGVSLRGQRWVHTGGCESASLFDLASLTKVICTTTAVARAHQSGLLTTSARVSDAFASFGDTRVQVSHLLDHSSGLPWWLPLHSHFHATDGLGAFDPKKTPREARAFYEAEIIKSHRPAEFEKRAEYSDLGFMLLGWMLEKATAKTLDEHFQESVARPLGLASATFLPKSGDFVPTEDCPWRKRVLRGEVHDDNCFVLGGVAAHAGLFGNVADIVTFGEAWLRSLAGTDQRILTRDTAQLFWTRSKVPGSTRALGWDSVSAQGSSAGQFFSPASRGHLGFTGTSLWIDPEKDLVVALLTNRVHPTRTNEKIRAFRPLFHDTLLTELGLG